MPLAWITGTGGLIGSYLQRSAPARWSVRAFARRDLDLTDRWAVERRFREEIPALIIHAAALSKSVACEKDPSLARTLNVEVTDHLTTLAGGIPFFFFSTDLVFDGKRGNYDEASPVNPLSVYGHTKAEAEQIVLRNPRHTVIRTSLNAGISPTRDRGFNEEMRAAWESGRTLNLFVDEFRCPIPATVTARAVWELADKQVTGLFHVAGAERLSRVDIGHALAGRWPQLTPRIKAGSLSDYAGPQRAPDTSLNCAKAQALLSFPLPRFIQWLRENPNEPI
jgi:dTDP-4-dehydrorhamnose reductase